MRLIIASFLALTVLASPAIAQQNTGGTVGRPAPVNADQMAGRDSSGNLRVPAVDASGNISVKASGGATTSANSQSVAPATDATWPVVGNVASGTADSGNPVKIAGLASGTNPTTASAFQRVNLWLGVNGQMVMGGTAFTGADATSNSMAQSTITSGNSGLLAVGNFSFNGTTWDRQRGDTNGAYVVPSPTAAAVNAIAANATAAVNSALVLKASAGNLYGLNIVAGASAGYVMLFDATSAPGDGAVTPKYCLPIAANAGIDLNWRSMPMAFATGITAVFSTTGCYSKTASATAFIGGAAK
jgi:hypothetical protein